MGVGRSVAAGPRAVQAPSMRQADMGTMLHHTRYSKSQRGKNSRGAGAQSLP